VADNLVKLKKIQKSATDAAFTSFPRHEARPSEIAIVIKSSMPLKCQTSTWAMQAALKENQP